MSDVLYIEDDDESRELGRLFLEKAGYNVRAVDNPELALDTYGEEPVVVSDYLFAGETTGVDVQDELDGSYDTFIMYTGYDQNFVERDSQTRLDNRELTFLKKGTGFDDLIAEVDKALEAPQH